MQKDASRRFRPRMAAALFFATCCRALAQEPPNAYESATQAGPQTAIVKQQFRFMSLDAEPAMRRGETRELMSYTTVNYGLAPDWSLSFRFPLEQRWQDVRPGGARDADAEFGVGDVTALAKWRVWRNDTSPLDSQRLAVVGGMEFPTAQDGFSSGSFDPIVGAAYTQVQGRHGFNADIVWKFTTDGDDRPMLAGESRADLMRYDLAYLYRVFPAEYGAESEGAWYLVGELNGLYETNGDHEIFLSPGVMYEATTWVFELSVQLPVIQQLDNRPEADFGLMLGFRLFF